MRIRQLQEKNKKRLKGNHGNSRDDISLYLSNARKRKFKGIKYSQHKIVVENSLHWVLDVCFREDDCRVRSGNAPENLAVLKCLALNILKHTKHHNRGIKVKMKRAD